MSDTLALAGRLQNESDDALLSLLNERHLTKRDLRDFFDLADALLATDSVNEALSHLDRLTLTQIVAGSERAETASDALKSAARSMLLFEEDGVLRPYDNVRQAFGVWPELGLPSVDDLVSEQEPALPLAPTAGERSSTDTLAAERAFETTVAVTELAGALASAPARELAKGGLAVPDA